MMQIATQEERDRLLHISSELIHTLREMYTSGKTPDELIQYMASIGVPKPGATVLLRKADVLTLRDAKLAVHGSDAYAYRREADEAFEDSVVQAMDKVERSEAAA